MKCYNFVDAVSKFLLVPLTLTLASFYIHSSTTRLSFRPEHLHEHMLPVSQFILASTSDGNEEVALEACEFWLVFASLDETMCTAGMMAVVESLLPQLLPTLVKSMVYSEEKREELLEQNAADEQQGDDRAQDVAPVFHRSKAKGGARKDDESDDDDDDDNYDDEKEWGLRTCAAASLDSLASGYAADRTLSILLPVLQECLSHADPWVREAGILALGAIEEGCAEEMYEHLNQLHPYLMSQVTKSDTLPQVVCISCWSLAKYSTWAVERAASGVQPDLVQKLTEAIAGRILDRNRKVQVASCSALGIFMENTGDMIIPYLEPIYKTLVLALERHQTRALLVTLETFGSMAEVIGPATGEGNLPNIYLPPLLQMWSQKAKQNPMDRTLLPLMESLASISMIIGMSFQPWSLETFENAMSTVNAAIMILSVDVYTDEEADPMVCATDVLDGLVEGLGSNFAELVSSSAQYKDHFLTLLKTLVGHDVEGVRMSAFALMGDIAIQCPVVMQDGMSELITEAILCIDATFPSVCNNAVWAIGEVLVKCVGNPAAIQPFATEIVQNLISLIMGSKYNGHEYNPISGLIENASTAMGRLAKVNPAFVATDLPRFLRGWVEGCAKVDDFSERRDAFEGLLLAIQVNPNSIKQAGPDLTETISVFLLAIMSWHVPKGNISPELLSGNYAFTKFPQEHADLHHHLGTFAHQFLKINGEAWGQVTNNLPVNVRRLLQEQYNL
jgi:transportin-1